MTDRSPAPNRVLGTLHADDGVGVVRMQDRFPTDIDDLWSALTEPGRLDRWLGTFTGDLRVGGQFRARYHSSGWEGTGRVDACDPPRHLRITTQADDTSTNGTIDVTLIADGDGTILVSEHRGLPVDNLPGYGAGIQIHLEDLRAHLTSRPRCDSDVRIGELFAIYQHLPLHKDASLTTD
jgi:uncharacterized protein YndB with AHSA1/START domain